MKNKIHSELKNLPFSPDEATKHANGKSTVMKNRMRTTTNERPIINVLASVVANGF